MWLALIPLAFIAVCEAYYAGAVFGPSVMVGRSAELVLAACCLGAAVVRPVLVREARVAAILAAVGLAWQFGVWESVTVVKEPGTLWMAERLGALVAAVGLAAILLRGSLPGWALMIGFTGAVGASIAAWQYGLKNWQEVVAHAGSDHVQPQPLVHPTVAELAHDHPLGDYQLKALKDIYSPQFGATTTDWPGWIVHQVMLYAQPVAWVALIVVALTWFVRRVRPAPPHTLEAWFFSRQWWYRGPAVPMLPPAAPATGLAARIEGAAWGLGLAGCGVLAMGVGGEMPDIWDAGKRCYGIALGVWIEPPFGNCNFTSGGGVPLVGLAAALALVLVGRWVRGKGPQRFPLEIGILLQIAAGVGVTACYALGTGMYNGDVVRAVTVDALAMVAAGTVLLLPRRLHLAVGVAGCLAVVGAQIAVTAYLLPDQPPAASASAGPGSATRALVAPLPTPVVASPSSGSDDETHGIAGFLLGHLGKAPSTVWRILWWRLAAGAVLAEPWHGYGPGATLAVLPDRPGFDKTWLVVPCYGEHTHQEPLEILMDGGIPLFAILVTAAGFTLAPLWRRRHQGVPAALLIAWAGVGANALVDCHLSQPGPVMLFGLLAGISWAVAATPVGKPGPSPFRTTSISILLAATALGAGLSYLLSLGGLAVPGGIIGIILGGWLGFVSGLAVIHLMDPAAAGDEPVAEADAAAAAVPASTASVRLAATIGAWLWSAVAIAATALLLRQAVLEFHDGGAPDMIVLRAQARLRPLYEAKDFIGYRREKATLRERLGPLDDLAYQEGWAAWRAAVNGTDPAERRRQLADADALAIEEARRLAPHEGNLALLYTLIDLHRRRGEDNSALTAAYRAALVRVRELLDQVPEDDKNKNERDLLRHRLEVPLPP